MNLSGGSLTSAWYVYCKFFLHTLSSGTIDANFPGIYIDLDI